jgi:hypothetical protein
MTDALADLARSPALYPVALDLVRDAVLFVRMDEVAYNESSFLDERIAARDQTGRWIPFAEVQAVLSANTSPRPLHFIFHAGHVGSTLLSRLIAETGRVLSLREPLPLRTLAEAYDMGTSGLDVRLEAFLRLWERGFPATEAVVLKATSTAERIAPKLLTLRPEAKAIALNVSVDAYIATLLAGSNSAVDLNKHGPERMHRLKTMGVEIPQPSTLGELAAMSWLAEALTQAQMRGEFGARVLALDFDQLLLSLESTMAPVLDHFGITHTDADIRSIAASPALRRYSKAQEHEYSPALRASLLDEARGRYPDQIRSALGWLERLGTTQDKVAALL